MALKEWVETWISKIPQEEVLPKVQNFFIRNNVLLVNATESEINGFQGSSDLTQALGDWFVNPAKLPKTIKIKLEVLPDGIRISISIKESPEYASSKNNKNKRLDNYFKEWIANLIKELT